MKLFNTLLSRGLIIIEHVVHIPFTDLHYSYEITYKLDLAEGTMGASKVISMRKNALFRQDAFDRIDHRNPYCFNVSHNFVVVSFHDLC
jgi:hypothetical protein